MTNAVIRGIVRARWTNQYRSLGVGGICEGSGFGGMCEGHMIEGRFPGSVLHFLEQRSRPWGLALQGRHGDVGQYDCGRVRPQLPLLRTLLHHHLLRPPPSTPYSTWEGRPLGASRRAPRNRRFSSSTELVQLEATLMPHDQGDRVILQRAVHGLHPSPPHSTSCSLQSSCALCLALAVAWSGAAGPLT